MRRDATGQGKRAGACGGFVPLLTYLASPPSIAPMDRQSRALVQCPSCRHTYPVGRSTCIYCGTPLQGVQPLAGPLCPKCGAVSEPAAGDACVACGTALTTRPQPAGWTCPNCGAPCAPNALECARCGTVSAQGRRPRRDRDWDDEGGWWAVLVSLLQPKDRRLGAAEEECSSEPDAPEGGGGDSDSAGDSFDFDPD